MKHTKKNNHKIGGEKTGTNGKFHYTDLDVKMAELSEKRHQHEVHWKYGSFLIGLIVTLAVVFASWHTDSTKDKESSMRDYNQRQAEIIQRTIDQKIALMKRVDNAMINLRRVNALIIERCKYNNSYTLEQQKLMRINSRYAIAKENTGLHLVFNLEAEKAVAALVDFDEYIISDLCSKNVPDDWAWRSKMRHANDLMGQLIKEDQEKLNALR